MIYSKKNIACILIIACLTTCFAPLALAQDNSYDSYMSEGQSLYEDNDLFNANVAFDNAIEQDGNKAEPYFYKGLILQSWDKYSEAMKQYDKAIEIDPKYAEAYAWKGNCLEALEKLDEAMVLYDKAIEIDPNYAMAYVLKGFLLKKQSKNDEAKECIAMGVKLDPTAAFLNEEQEITMQIDNPYMSIGGKIKEVDVGKGTAPKVVNDRTLLPIRSLVEELGGTVEWIDNENKMIIKLYTKTIELFVDQTVSYINGVKETIDIAPTVINDRTYLPLRYIAETIGCDVAWDEIGQYINIKLDNVNLGAFEELSALFNIYQSRWGWDNRCSKEFNSIRNHLGDKFEAELFKFIDHDIESCLYSGVCLLDADFLEGNKPLPELALKVYDKGLSLPQNDQDEMFMVYEVSLSVVAAVANKKYGDSEKAKNLKAQAEKLMKDDPNLRGAFPAMYPEDLKIYEAL